MILKGNELREKFNEQMQKIEILSRNFAGFLSDQGIDESDAEELLTYFASDNSLPEFQAAYKDMLGEHIGIDYFKAVKKISNISDIIELYSEFAIIACQKKMPVGEFVKILDGKEIYEIEEDLEHYEPVTEGEKAEDSAAMNDTEQEVEIQPDEYAEEEPELEGEEPQFEEEKVDEKNHDPHVEIIDHYKPHVEKNFFTQTIEDPVQSFFWIVPDPQATPPYQQCCCRSVTLHFQSHDLPFLISLQSQMHWIYPEFRSINDKSDLRFPHQIHNMHFQYPVWSWQMSSAHYNASLPCTGCPGYADHSIWI